MLKIVLLGALLVFAAQAGASDLKEVDETSDATQEATDTQESRHKGCQQMCEEDGEDPLDCEQYCVQVV